MNTLVRAIRFLFIALFLVGIVAFLAGWWFLRRSLPQLEGSVTLPELKGEVTVDRDAYGVPHIRANSLEDLLVAQGYVLTQDRLWQMDILRRVAAGELSEIFGPQTLELDRQYRTLGFRPAAERDVAALDPESRLLLEAYARGVNRYIEEHKSALPWEFTVLGYQPRSWKPSDSLLVAGYMYRTLTWTWETELKRGLVAKLAGVERARDLILKDSPHDHYIVDGPVSALELEVKGKGRSPRAAPPSKATRRRRAAAPRPELLPAVATSVGGTANLWPQARAFLGQFDEEVRAGFGSNNWVVDGKHTASGKPLLANDTHLQLRVPCIWYIVHLTAPGWNVKGFTLPGAPLVIIGHNDRIAWGYTNNGADVQDLYIETFKPASAIEYRANGRWIPAEIRHEVIHVKGRPDAGLDVFVTRHGPIVSRDEVRSYALKWTALEPGGLALGHGLVGRARNWQEFRGAMRRIPGPAQNAVYADVDGNIGFIAAGRIPMRKSGDGSVPAPGDTGEYEWTGYIPFDELPQVLNPPGGIIATANARVVGPNYPHYLTDRWTSPYRTARIYDLLGERKKLQPADFSSFQMDIFSAPHKFLAEQLVRSSQVVKPKDARARDLIARLTHWRGRADPASMETAFTEYVRRSLMGSLLKPVLGPRLGLYEWREAVFLEKILRERPPEWLPPEFKSYDQLLADSADRAVEHLAADTKQSKPSAWRWGNLNALVMVHRLGRQGLRRRLLSVGPKEQSGTVYSVKAAQPSHGPAMRFVADLSNWDNSLMTIAMGESGQYGSAHYRDQFRAWFEGRSLPAPFSEPAVEKARKHRLRLLPGGAASR